MGEIQRQLSLVRNYDDVCVAIHVEILRDISLPMNREVIPDNV